MSNEFPGDELTRAEAAGVELAAASLSGLPMYQAPIVMLDFETTGLSPAAGARITEVAALRIEGGRIVDRFVSLINCRVRMPPFITSLTGITQRMVDTAPCVSQVVPELLRFIGNDTLSAHNASFDEKFLLAECEHLGLRPQYRGLLCSLKLSRRLFPGLPSYKLGMLSSSFGIRFNGTAHRAEADAEVSAQLLLHIAEHLGRMYGVSRIDPELLSRVTALSAAKVPAFLKKELANHDGSIAA
jgi:DNA polymerase-3 subunit epsilon